MNTTRIHTSNVRTIKLGLALLTIGLANIGFNPAIAQDKMASDKMAATSKMASSTSLAKGSFVQVTHATKGMVTIAGTGGKRTLKLSNFQTAMGPQLHVYLVSGSSLKTNGAIQKAVSGKKFVDLGTLKSFKGSQTYAIPAGKNIKGASVVIWCDKFDVAFGSATLS